MAAILAAIFLAAWGLPPSSSPQPAHGVPEQTQPAQHEAAADPSVEKQKSEADQWASKKENEEGREQSVVERTVKFVREYNAEIVTISTAIMALFTAALFTATFLLWFGGEKHSKRELRAYVFPIDTKVRNFKTSERISAFVKIRNSGQTPAYKFTCQVKMIAGPFPQTDFTISQEEAGLTPSYLGPLETIQYTPTRDTPLSWEQAEDVAQGRWAIYVFGRIDYVDAFKVSRWTTFRAFARGDNGRMFHVEGEPDVLALVFDKEGNDAT